MIRCVLDFYLAKEKKRFHLNLIGLIGKMLCVSFNVELYHFNGTYNKIGMKFAY